MKKWMLLMVALTITSPLHAQPTTSPVSEASEMSDGVVRKIDAANGKITLKHGPIANLDMPGMTMVFRVQPVALLKKVKVGDAVKFQVERINGGFTVTEIQPVQ
jgi:Cu(I)/Ag(I) efflux system periplasmic protein CusF